MNQRHNIPLRFSPQPVLRRHTEIILRRGRNIHTGRYRSPACVLTTKPHDSAGAHRRACARISCSFMKIYCESLLMERKPPKFPVLLRRAHPGAAAACIFCRIGGRVIKFIRDSWSRIAAFVRAVYPCTGIGQHNPPGKTHPSVSVGVAGTNVALTAVRSLHCSITQRLTDSCSGSASGCRFEN